MKRVSLDSVAEQVTTKVARRKDPCSPYVGLEHIDPGSSVLSRTSPSSASISVNTAFQPDDVLFGKLRPNLRKCVQARFPGYCSTDIIVLRARPGTDPGFLGHLLRSEPVFRHAERNSIGTGMPRTSWSTLREMLIHVPDLREQRRIAEILDTIDDTIRSSEGVIDKLADLRSAMVADLIPMSLPSSWTSVPLEAVIDTARPIAYGILMPGEHMPGGVPVVKVRDISNGSIARREYLLHTSLAMHQAYRRSALEEGDVLFTIRGTVGRTAVVPAELHGANITQDTARLAVTGVKPSYLAGWLESKQFRRYVAVHTIGQAVTGMNLRELRRAPLALPPVDEQVRIGDTLASQSRRLAVEREYVGALRELRCGLVADLLSGRVRTVPA